MRKASFFSLIGAVLLAASSLGHAAPPGMVDLSAYSYDTLTLAYMPALDQPAEHVPIVAVVGNWQPEDSGDAVYKILTPEPACHMPVVRRFAAGHTEVGWRS